MSNIQHKKRNPLICPGEDHHNWDTSEDVRGEYCANCGISKKKYKDALELRTKHV